MNKDQLETAARHACKMLGLDPDERVSLPPPEGSFASYNGAQWMRIAPKVREQWAIMEGMREVEEQEEKKSAEYDRKFGNL